LNITKRAKFSKIPTGSITDYKCIRLIFSFRRQRVIIFACVPSTFACVLTNSTSQQKDTKVKKLKVLKYTFALHFARKLKIA